jgi:beta-lactamase superfamily II metal-dependent hydrolase
MMDLEISPPKCSKSAIMDSNTGTSSSFLSKVNPEVVVIEVGAGNTYGHPASGTINRLQSNDVKIYRTDETGNIVIKF